MKLLTRKQAAARLGVSLSTFERDVQPHIVLVRQTARLIHVTEEELERWVVEKQEQPRSAFDASVGSPRPAQRLAERDTASRSGSSGAMTAAAKAKLEKLQKRGTRGSSKAA